MSYDHEGDGRCDLRIAERPRWMAVMDRPVLAAAEELRCALGRLLAGTSQPGEICTMIEKHAPLLYKWDGERQRGAERAKEFGDGD